MKLHALVSFYNERPAWLGAMIASLAPHVDNVIAIDGAYALYPNGQGQSPSDQGEAVREAARALGMGCLLYEPARPWMGNETEKRSALFALADCCSAPDDWYIVMDGDQLISDWGCDLKVRLAETQHDAADVTFWQHREHFDPDERPFATPFDERQTLRIIFRAIPGVTVGPKHYDYVTPDGRYLWGNAPTCVPAEDLTVVRVEHRNKRRDLWRNKEREQYYARRDDLNIEGVFREG